MNIDHTLTWEVARVGGFLAYALLGASVVIGLVLSLGVHSPRWPRFLTSEFHRHVTLLGLVFTGIHGLAVWIDPFTGFTPAEVLVPMVAHYRPVWLALGIVGGYLTAAIWLSDYVRQRIGYRAWHAFHLLAFAAFLLATIHGLAAGSDSASPWAITLYAVSLATVLGLLLVRVGRGLSGVPRLGINLAACVAALAIVAFAAIGPTRAGWNTIANQGQGNGASAAWLASHPTAATPTPPASFSADLRVTLVDQGLLAGSFSGPSPGRVELLLTNSESALGLALTDGWQCEGPLTITGDASVSAQCVGIDGSALSVALSDLRREDDAVVGRLTVTRS